MELRVLQYFLAVTREQSILGAAESLHLSQPTLSRQLRDMEQELGKKLFIRSNRHITLTEEGMILKKRAEEILSLVQKTQNEIALSDENLFGDISIGSSETDGVRHIVRGAKILRGEYPDIHFHIISGDKPANLDQLESGFIDFAVIHGDFDESKYDFLNLPSNDSFGVLMRRDDPLSEKDIIKIEDLIHKPLIVSRQGIAEGIIDDMFPANSKPNIIASYNLIFNGSLMADEGMGYVLGFDKIINVSGDSSLCFRPLEGAKINKMRLVWKKYQVLSKVSEKYLNCMLQLYGEGTK